MRAEFSSFFDNKSRLIEREIKDCISFFEEQPHNKIKGERIGRVHSNNLEIGRIHGERGYFWEIDGVRKISGTDPLTGKEYKELVEKIHNITIPYALHIKNMKKTKKS